MNFYKLLLLITLIVLFISLVIIGTILYNSSKNSVFPPNISKCPDHYYMNNDTCYHISNNDELPIFTLDQIKQENVGNPGTDKLSEICGKKIWAKNNNINWDGLTNNHDICRSNQ